MLDQLLKKITAFMILTFLIGTTIFYILLDNFFERKALEQIEQSLLFSESIQEYVSKQLKPPIYKLIEQGVLPKEYFNPSLLSSTYIDGYINDIFQKKNQQSINNLPNVQFKFASNNPTNPNNLATPYESKILNILSKNHEKTFFERIKIDDKSYMFAATPSRRNSASCLKCHGDPKDAPKGMIEIYGDQHGFNEKVGNLRAINALYSEIDSNHLMITFFFSIELLMAIIFISIYFVVRYFVHQMDNKDKLITKQSRFAAMGEMISMIAHQWRQPLTGMGMTTNNLLLDIELQDIDEVRWEKNLKLINTQIAYLSNTIDDFKNFFKPNQETVSVNILELLNEGLQIIDSSIKNQAITIEIDCEINIHIKTKKNDLLQIILNLIKNSMDAYADKESPIKKITISVIENKKNIIIKTHDEAGGIPIEIIDKIFDPYFSTKHEKNGTGLGLYMSKMIIEDHLNGELNVQSFDNQTTFSIILLKQELEVDHGN